MAGKSSPVSFFRAVATLDTKEEENICLCLSRNRNLLTGHESNFKVWSFTSDECQWTLKHVVDIPEKGNVTCISLFPDSDYKYAVSFNNCVAIYSVNSESSKILQPLHLFRFNSDEINQLDINSRASLLCSGDDNGDVMVIDIENLCLYKSLTRQHSNICSTVKFNPRKPWEIFSGGLDCQLIRWDFNRGRPLSVFDIQVSEREVGVKGKEKRALENYMVNPPMIHSIDVLSSIHCVVCGLGNGSISVYSASSPKQLEAVCSAPLHSAGVACLCCLETPGREPKLTNHLVVSGGNDTKICVSKLTYERKGTYVKKPKKQHARLQLTSCELELMVTIRHSSKVNWIAVDRDGTAVSPAEATKSLSTLMIVVADQTSFVTVYEVNCCLE